MTSLGMTGARSGLREMAYERIRKAIVGLEIAPGSAITEEALGVDLGVSRPVLREALQRLQSEGLVERRPNGRLRTAEISTGQVRQLFAVRSALEELAVREAGETMTPERLEALRKAVPAGPVGRQLDAAETREAGTRFHATIAAHAANPVSNRLMEQIAGQVDRYRNLSVTNEKRSPRAMMEHQAIFDALATGEIERAALLMREHVRASMDSVLAATEAALTPE